MQLGADPAHEYGSCGGRRRRRRWRTPPSRFLSGSCGLPRLPLAAKTQDCRGTGTMVEEEEGGFMGAQSFSKYLPFPLYCGRLMAFDVGGDGGWECGGSGCWDGGREEWMNRRISIAGAPSPCFSSLHSA
ncbi:hypothetical protein EYF80_029051 [Liparis tanakae]|uniref:Uncharacterized protein n=1 Tax=Liparis tanakae TaxID=230148 RepID=A0A4Z2H4B8_9TELE|nr:hypothetical protein EYF80_029051 [Liparis tanakae]